MTTLPNLTTVLTAPEDLALVYAYSPANPGAPDAKITMANLRAPSKVETLTNKQIGIPATPSKLYGSLLQLVGAKATHIYRATGNLVIPGIAAGAEADITFAVTGAVAGDSVTFNPTAAPAAGLVIAAAWVSAADTVTVRVRNGAVGAYAGGNLASIILVVRSAAPD